LLLAFAIAVPAAAQGTRAPAELARSLQQRYDKIRDFKADFTQTSRGGALRTETRGAGTVAIKKPGRMRWTYSRPERQEIISDGVTMFTYVPDDRQVLKAAVPGDDQATTSMLFLAGKGDISRDFIAADAPSPVPGAVGLKLTPRQSEPDYEYLVVAVDPRSLQIRALTTRDQLGADTTIVFQNLKENTNIPDRTFTFTPPKGVQVDALK
jgi:outer membrane lipoprotein carrier protein